MSREEQKKIRLCKDNILPVDLAAKERMTSGNLLLRGKAEVGGTR